MPLKPAQTIDLYDTTAELDPSDPTGQFAVVLNPLTLYVLTDTGYQVVGSGTNPPAPTPASESGQGVVELATQAEVEAATSSEELEAVEWT